MMTQADIERIVTMDEAEYRAVLASALAEDRRSYAAYCEGSRPTVPPGSSVHAAGHGSFTTDLNPGGIQDRWHEAKGRLERLRCIRSGAWKSTPAGADVVAYEIGLDARVHRIEVVRHGVDVSGCRTPAEAIARVCDAIRRPAR